MKIHSFKELVVELDPEALGWSANQWESRCSNRVYKSTDCGAWLRFTHDPDGVEVGSIIEGVDVCAESVELQFPFNADELYKALTDIEEQCTYIWNETHGCEQCEADGYMGEWGYPSINPDCPVCHGEGTII